MKPEDWLEIPSLIRDAFAMRRPCMVIEDALSDQLVANMPSSCALTVQIEFFIPNLTTDIENIIKDNKDV